MLYVVNKTFHVTFILQLCFAIVCRSTCIYYIVNELGHCTGSSMSLFIQTSVKTKCEVLHEKL